VSVSAVQKGLPNSTWIFISFLGWFVSLIPLPSSTHDVPRNWGLTVAIRLSSWVPTATGSPGAPIELLLELTARNGGEVLMQ